MGVPLWANASKGVSLGTVTFESGTNLATLPGLGYVDGQQIMFDTLTAGAVGAVRADVAYFVVDVAGDSFRVAPSPGAPVIEFTADGGGEAYAVAGLYRSEDIRHAMNGLLARGGHAGGFSARTGLFPHASETAQLTISGGQWSTADLTGVVRHASGQTFIVAHGAESGNVDAAEAVPRIDAVDLRVHVGEFDGGARVETELVYVRGFAEELPSEPPVSESSERVGTILIPAAGSGNPPTRNRTHKYTAAVGGIIPVLDESQYPGAGGRHRGLTLWDVEKGALVVNTNAGSDYQTIASITGHDYTGAMTRGSQSPMDWNTYTPAITGAGSAGFSTRTGMWKRVAPKTVVFTLFLVVSSNGSGSTTLRVSAPTNIYRGIRQAADLSVEGAAGGEGGNRDGHAVSFTSTTGDMWDRIRFSNGTSPNLNNMVGADLVSGMFIILHGTYREE